MKYLLILITTLSLLVQANDNAVNSNQNTKISVHEKLKETNKELCETIASLSETILNGRNRGIDVVEAMNLMEGSKISIAIVKDAYRLPLYTTEDYKLNQIRKFKTKWFLACIDALGD